jgi:hypothetical protein
LYIFLKCSMHAAPPLTNCEAPEYAAFSMILVDAVEKRRIS